MATAHHLQTVFDELDYLDDGYKVRYNDIKLIFYRFLGIIFQDGVVSHVGLRRIILETPEVENELGATFTRYLEHFMIHLNMISIILQSGIPSNLING